MPPTVRHPLLRRDRLARYLLVGAGAAAAGYGAYRLYHSEAAASGRWQLVRLRAALAAYADAFGTGADTLQLLLADLRSFLQSDRQNVPRSLRQLARLIQSQEVADTTSVTVAALVRGITGAGSATHAATTNGSHVGGSARAAAALNDGRGALDRMLDALLSEQGQGLVSVAVSLGARNLVTAFCETQHRLAAEDAERATATSAVLPPDLTNRLLDFLASSRGQQLAVMMVTAFVSSGMRAYLDQTLDLNFYEDLFGAMAKPEHLEAVKQCVGVFARDVVSAYLVGPSAAMVAMGAGGGQEVAAGGGAPQQAHLRLSSSIHELLSGGATSSRQRKEEAVADTGSPCGSSASGEWARQQQHQVVSGAVPQAPSDIDSDVLLHPAAKDGGDCARSHNSGGWAVRTPSGAGEAGGVAARPVLPQLRHVQQQDIAPAAGSSMSREGSGNLDWISAVGKEWLNVAQHPQGRTVMVELAGTAAKEAARGISAALVDQFRMQWLLVVALAMLLLTWLLQRTLGVLLG